jgi:CRISPR type III-B/RAMP module-associated protein Cmr5
MARLREQERAKAAKDAVTQFRGAQSDPAKLREYRQELQQLPSRILASGLGQTLAFYAARATEAQKAIGAQLARFLLPRGDKTLDLLDHIVNIKEAGEYRRLTRDAMAYAEWLKRYSAALIPKE